MTANLKFAVFIDYDNIAIGVKNTLNRPFDYKVVLDWLHARGEILAQIAYGNWGTHSDFKYVSRSLTQHGVKMEHLESTPSGNKNGADIALSIDAVELIFTQKHIDAFCILSGDSDFLPLVHKLKKHDKRVYVVAGLSFTSDNLRRNCHEFVSYETLCGHPSGRFADAPAAGPRRGDERLEPLENAVPAISRAIREMEARNEIPYVRQLRTAVMHFTPGFDERDFGRSSFKDLLFDLVRQGYFRRKMIGAYRFCIAEADAPPQPARDSWRQRSAPRQYDRSEFERSEPRRHEGRVPGRYEGFRAPRPAPSRFDRRIGRTDDRPRREADTRKAVEVINEAVAKIEGDGKLAELDLLYKTALDLDSQFRVYGCSAREFRSFVGKLAMQGHFRLRNASGTYVIESDKPSRGRPAREPARLSDGARRVLDAVIAENEFLVRAGVPNKQIELMISTQAGFDPRALGVDGPGHLLELAVREGLLNARRDDSGTVRYFGIDSSENLSKREEKPASAPLAAGDTTQSAEESSETTRTSKPAGFQRPFAQAQGTAPVPTPGESAGNGSLDSAMEIVCDALKADRRLFEGGLLRSELREALQAAAPKFDLKQYGMRTFRVLLDKLCADGFLDVRSDDDAGVRYFGTERLAPPVPAVQPASEDFMYSAGPRPVPGAPLSESDAASPFEEADLSESKPKGLLGWLKP